ncbi:MAG: hypothetical protein ABIP50_03660 [Candidatus Saccharimonadales bacterium]
MKNPLKNRQQFSCGTLSTSLLIENGEHPEAVTLGVIDEVWSEFQVFCQRDIIMMSTTNLDEVVESSYSRVKQSVTLEVNGTKLTIGATLTVRKPGIEVEIGHDLARLLFRSHHLVDTVSHLIEMEVQRAGLPEDPFGSGMPFDPSNMPEFLRDLMGERGFTVIELRPRG